MGFNVYEKEKNIYISNYVHIEIGWKPPISIINLYWSYNFIWFTSLV